MKRFIVALALFQTLTIMNPSGEVKSYFVTPNPGGAVTVVPLNPSTHESSFTTITPSGRNTGTIHNDNGVGFYNFNQPIPHRGGGLIIINDD